MCAHTDSRRAAAFGLAALVALTHGCVGDTAGDPADTTMADAVGTDDVRPDTVPAADAAPDGETEVSDTRLATTRPPSTGFDCDCDQIGPIALPLEPRPPPTGRFVLDESLQRLVRSSLDDGTVTVLGASHAVIPAYVTNDPWPDIITAHAGSDGVPPGAVVYSQVADGVWDTPLTLAEVMGLDGTSGWPPDHCVALVDVVGDPAWDLVCLNPPGWFEGELTADGRQRQRLDMQYWHPAFHETLSRVDAVLRGPEVMSRDGHMIRFRDYDGDGAPEATLTLFDPELQDFLLEWNESGYYDAEPFRRGMTFATCDWDLDGDRVPDAVYAFKETGNNDPENANHLYRIDVDDSGDISLPRVDPLPPGSTDWLGWFGVARESYDRTPMGCSRVNWIDGYFLAQDDLMSILVHPQGDGTVCNAAPCVPGLTGPAQPMHWGVTFTSWRGRVHEGIVASGDQGPGRGQLSNGVRYIAHLGADGVRAYNMDETHTLADFDANPGDYYGLSVFAFGDDGRPDALLTLDVGVEAREPIRLFRNDLDLVDDEQLLCLEVLGRGGESAIVEFRFDGGEVETQLVADGGQIASSPAPVVFQGVVGPTQVTVLRPGRPPEVFDDLEPSACYNLLPRGDDGTLPAPVRLR